MPTRRPSPTVSESPITGSYLLKTECAAGQKPGSAPGILRRIAGVRSRIVRVSRFALLPHTGGECQHVRTSCPTPFFTTFGDHNRIWDPLQFVLTGERCSLPAIRISLIVAPGGAGVSWKCFRVALNPVLDGEHTQNPPRIRAN